MSVNGHSPTVEDELTLEDPVTETDWPGAVPPTQQSVAQHYAFLKKLRVLHYLGNLYATRVVPAYDEWQRLRTTASEWTRTENDRRATRREAIEAEIKGLRDHRDSLQREQEQAELAYGQAHTLNQAMGSLDAHPVTGRDPQGAGAPGGGWTHTLAALGAKLEPGLSILAAVICGSVLGVCFGTLFGITSVTDLQRGDGWYPAAFAAVVGMTIVLLLGKLVSFAVRMYSDRVSSNTREPWLPCIIACAGVLLFMAAEVALEGFGLREVHRDYLTSLQRVDGTPGSLPLLWPPVYFFLGILVSGPFLGCKLGAAWCGRRSTTPTVPSGGNEAVPLAAERETDTAQRLTAAAIQHRQLRERCEELDRRVGRLKEEHRALEPLDDSSGALLEQVRAAETAYRAERDRYDKLLESLIFLRSPRVESRPALLDD